MRAVLFDLDGVLVDSEPASLEAWTEALARFGYELTADDHQGFMGKTDRELAENYARILDVSVVELEATNQACLLDRLQQGIYVFDDVPPILQSLDDSPTAVASNSHRWRLEAVLRGAGLGDRFEVIVSSDDVGRPKPEPDVYLRAAAQLKVASSDCVVVEDTPTGIRAGRAAGMRVVAVDRGTYGRDRLGEADLVIPALPANVDQLW